MICNETEADVPKPRAFRAQYACAAYPAADAY
jgi:hypothetical protein